MGVTTTTASVVQVISPRKISLVVGSMSQGFHHHPGIFGFSASEQEQQQQHHVAQQSRRDKLRMQGFEPASAASHHTHPLVVGGSGIEEDDVDDEGGGGRGGGGGMLSEMFNFPSVAAGADPAGPSATELLASQMHGAGGYRLPPNRQVVPGSMVGFSNVDWYGGDGGGGGSTSNDLSAIGDAKQLNPESAAAMQLFLMNPQQPRSPPPPPPHHHQHHLFEGSFGGGHHHQLVDSQGLSLSLSSSLHQFEMAKAEQNVLYFQQPPPQQQHQLQSQGGGYGGAVGVNLQLRNSRYARAAQELLEEFCSVGRGAQFRAGSSRGKHHGGGGSSSSNPNPSGAVGSSSSSKDVIPALSPADRFEHQRNKSKLLTMLDEVDRRYNHYCEQMQMVVTSFDSVMGYGAATPYTALAQKAMSRHFRCLKDAIGEQLKRACEALGEKDAGGAGGLGITKGETPRLRLLDQSLRQQRAFHQMGMIDQEAWRPQRGLPECSVTLLRAWLFEHFLHPYPSDADKHLLARQTGLSRNQVSNWFINARVRLWKPMVEEMYQQESKDETDVGHDTVQTAAAAAADDHQASHSSAQQQQQQQQHHHHSQQQVLQRPETEASASAAAAAGDSDHTSMHQRFPNIDHVINDANILPPPVHDQAAELCAAGLGPAARMRLGTAGDVSLTLGLRHAGTPGGGGGGGGSGQDINSRFTTTVRDHFGA